MPRVLSIDPARPDAGVIGEAAAVLGRGGLVAFPTETVYGLGARGLHAADVGRIFAAKRRPPTHPLILHVDGEAMAKALARVWPPEASRLAAAFWPGPLTLVVPRGADVPDAVTGGLNTMAVRAPNHPIALALIRAVGEPLAAPSANAHTHVSPTSAAHVLRSLGNAVDLVLDGGACAHGIESTVVSVADDPPCVLRPGALPLSRLLRVSPGLVHEAIVVEGDVARASPGLAAKHYAPVAKLVVRDGPVETLRAVLDHVRSGGTAGAILWSEDAKDAFRRVAEDATTPADAVRVAPLPSDAEAYARSLFAALHDLDDHRVGLIVVERPPVDAAWWAVADRLARAARA